jgi:excisionase family DNA binding protein
MDGDDLYLMCAATAKLENVARRLLTYEQAADYLAVGRTTMYDLVARGELQAVKIGRCTRLRPEDLEAYVEAQLSVRSGASWTKNGRNVK